jgi:type IX secretion system PorP/SprF family membrane protein
MINKIMQKMKNKIRLGLFLWFVVIKMNAQQEAMITQHLFNKLNYNPGYAGAREKLSGILMYRNQWASIQGSPVQYMLSVSAPLGKSNHNLGLVVNRDVVGPIAQFNIYANYAYKLKFNEEQSLRIGTRVGLDKGSVNLNTLSQLDANDPNFVNEANNITRPVVGLGLYFQSSTFAFTLSAPNFIQQDVSSSQALSKYFQSFAGVEYLFKINDKWALKPAVFGHYQTKSPLNVDMNAYVIYNEFLWLGAGYRTSKTFMAGMQIEFNDRWIPQLAMPFRIGYSYDFSNNNYSNATSGVHELFIGFDLGKKGSPNDFIQSTSPRYF